MNLKVGDLVRGWCATGALIEEKEIGIVIELQDDRVVPPSAWIMWPSGEIGKEWSDEIEIVTKKPGGM
jgi:hypothetical protein